MSVQCPNCKQYQTISYLGLSVSIALLSTVGFFFGMIFPPLIIAGFILLAIGSLATTTSLIMHFTNADRDYMCLNCHYKFKIKKESK